MLTPKKDISLQLLDVWKFNKYFHNPLLLCFQALRIMSIEKKLPSYITFLTLPSPPPDISLYWYRHFFQLMWFLTCQLWGRSVATLLLFCLGCPGRWASARGGPGCAPRGPPAPTTRGTLPHYNKIIKYNILIFLTKKKLLSSDILICSLKWI